MELGDFAKKQKDRYAHIEYDVSLGVGVPVLENDQRPDDEDCRAAWAEYHRKLEETACVSVADGYVT